MGPPGRRRQHEGPVAPMGSGSRDWTCVGSQAFCVDRSHLGSLFSTHGDTWVRWGVYGPAQNSRGRTQELVDGVKAECEVEGKKLAWRGSAQSQGHQEGVWVAERGWLA